MITYFIQRQKLKIKKKCKKFETLTTTVKSFDTTVIPATTPSFFSLSLMVIGLRAIPISNGIAFGLTVSNEVI